MKKLLLVLVIPAILCISCASKYAEMEIASGVGRLDEHSVLFIEKFTLNNTDMPDTNYALKKNNEFPVKVKKAVEKLDFFERVIIDTIGSRENIEGAYLLKGNFTLVKPGNIAAGVVGVGLGLGGFAFFGTVLGACMNLAGSLIIPYADPKFEAEWLIEDLDEERKRIAEFKSLILGSDKLLAKQIARSLKEIWENE